MRQHPSVASTPRIRRRRIEQFTLPPRYQYLLESEAEGLRYFGLALAGLESSGAHAGADCWLSFQKFLNRSGAISV
jgi:hypothetical protein